MVPETLEGVPVNIGVEFVPAGVYESIVNVGALTVPTGVPADAAEVFWTAADPADAATVKSTLRVCVPPLPKSAVTNPCVTDTKPTGESCVWVPSAEPLNVGVEFVPVRTAGVPLKVGAEMVPAGVELPPVNVGATGLVGPPVVSDVLR